jgi:hypothetical protein
MQHHMSQIPAGAQQTQPKSFGLFESVLLGTQGLTKDEMSIQLVDNTVHSVNPLFIIGFAWCGQHVAIDVCRQTSSFKH